MALKQNVANWIEVRLVDATDTPVTGLAWNAVAVTNTFKLHKAGAAPATWNPASAAAWSESGLGYYMVQLAPGDCDTLGRLVLIATTTTGQPWAASETVEANLVADAYSRLGAPAGASVSADIAAIQAKTVNLPASPAAVGSNMGSVSSVTGDVGGKVLGGGAGVMSAVGVRAVDSAGNAIAPAATALSTADYTAARAAKLDQLDAAISSRAPSATAVSNADYTAARAAKLDNADVATSTRLATAGYTAPDNATIGTTATAVAAVKAKTDNLPANPAAQTLLDVAVSTRLAAAGYTAPDNASVTAIKAKTDNLPVDPADESLLEAATTAIRNDIAALTFPAAPDNAGIAAIKAKTDALPASPANEATSAAIQGVVAGNAVSLSAIDARLGRALGLLDENTVREPTAFDGDDITAAEIRLYDSAGNAALDDGATGLIAAYVASYVYSAPGVLDKATMTRAP
jgi:hypothetical protein